MYVSEACQKSEKFEKKVKFQIIMPFTCSFCKISGDKGYFSFPKDPQARADCLGLAGLPLEQDLKVKITSMKICFRHYKDSDFYFTDGGNQIRIRRGK